ncbi:MAG: hypothetical protein RL748_4583, partial [Pseudomonadota bacterium]
MQRTGINAIEYVLRSMAWLALLAVEAVVGYLLRPYVASPDYYLIAFISTVVFFALIPLLGRHALVWDMQELYLYDVLLQGFGLIIAAQGVTVTAHTAYLSAANTIWLLQIARILWPAYTNHAGQAIGWPPFGIISWVRSRFYGTPRQAEFSLRYRITFFSVILICLALGYGLQHANQSAHAPLRPLLTLAICLYGTRKVITHLQTTEANEKAAASAVNQLLQQKAQDAITRAKDAEERAEQNQRIAQLYQTLSQKHTELEAAHAALETAHTELARLNAQQTELALNLAKRNQNLRDEAHDVKSPIAATGIKTLLAKRLASSDEQRKLLEEVELEVRQISGMMADIVQRADIATPLPQLALQACSTQALRKSIWPPLRLIANAHQVLLDTNNADFAIQTEPEKLGRIISNLVSNAILHAPPQREVSVQLDFYQDGPFCHIAISDNGNGFANANGADHAANFMQVLTDLEEKQAQARRNMNSLSEYRRNGIGLHNVYNLCIELGVTMTLDSAPGQGSVFRVAVPLV